METIQVRALAASKAKGKLEPFEFSLGSLGTDQVDIKVQYCGICHSDLTMLDNDFGLTQYPFVPGHEAVGVITAKRRSCAETRGGSNGRTRVVLGKLHGLLALFSG